MHRSIMQYASTLIAISCVSCACVATAAPLTFEKDVRPILKAQCFHCHGEDEELPGGLDVRLVRLMRDGGDSGAAIVPGDADSSLLWERIASDEMPEGSKKLSPDQKATIRTWIQQGAKTARPEPESVEEARFTVEELSHWAYQPVVRPPIPRVDEVAGEIANPIDCFVAAELANHELNFSTPADARTLIRRVSFDVCGLPPTPREVQQFISGVDDDDIDDAYSSLVERMLNSPHFGVRWARHWLDVAGYAESNGGPTDDSLREHAWRYRDYVIDAFNNNKPIDKFYIEQLAGDELIDSHELINGQVDIHNPRHQELLTATGFLRMAPDATQTANQLSDRNRAVADMIQVVSSAMLGITVGCAQCHDHKYDPIGIDDYYAFRAIFDPAFPIHQWQQPNARLVDFTTDESRKLSASIEAECKKLDEDLQRRRKELASKIYEQKLADVPDADRDATQQAVEAKPGDRDDEQKRLLDLYPMVKPIDFIAGFLVEYDNKAYREFEKDANKIAELRATKPAPKMVMVAQERIDVVPESHVFFRGDPESPRKSVAPSELFALARHDGDKAITANDVVRPSTGRRLAYARQLTDGTHPLAARVFVNRVWHHYFGRGLVETIGNFGIAGERPSHPQLLDWLADDFVQNGWNHKRLHKMILTSRTYRQSTGRTPKAESVDPENRLLARMSLRRLDAESIRDALISVVGDRNDEIGGASVPVTENPEGKVVIGKRKVRDGLKAGVDDTAANQARRSAFIQIQRRLPLNMLATFDQPEMNPNCEVRRPTTVATQSLWFMNDDTIVKMSQRLADRLIGSVDNNADRIRSLYEKVYAKPPTDDELAICQQFLSAQQEHFSVTNNEASANEATSDKGPNDEKEKSEVANVRAERQAFASLVQTMFASNQFLYLD